MSATLPQMTAAMMMGLEEPPRLANIVPFKFEIKYKEDASAPSGLRAEEWVEWHIKLTGSQTISRTCRDAIKRIQKGASRATEPNDEAAMIWRTIEPYYKSWKAGSTEEIIDGTPLAVWPGVTADVVELLKPFKIRSVEDLSMIGDALMQKLPHPNMGKFRDMAKRFLATKETAAVVRDLMDRDDQVAALREQLAAMQKALADAGLKQADAAAELAQHNPAVKLRRRAAA